LLIERIVIAWLQVAYYDAREAQQPEANIRLAELQLKRQAQAEKQLRATIKALADLRKAQKPITAKAQQAASTTPTTRPIVPMPVHDAIPTYNGPTNRIKDLINRVNGQSNGMNGKLNGSNGKNGHKNSANGFLELCGHEG